MRSAFTGILAFAAVTLCMAVTPAEAQTSVGVKGGLVVAKLKTAPDSGDVLGERQDFSAGVFIVPKRRAPATVQIESLYSRRGTSLDADVFGFGLGDVRLSYLDVSALLKLRAGSGDTAGYLIAGPTLGIKLDAEVVLPFGLSPSIEGMFKDTETGITVGAGLEAGRYVLEGRYFHGLTSVVKGIDFAGLGAKSRTFSVMAGVRF
jgi:hypothetical protein